MIHSAPVIEETGDRTNDMPLPNSKLSIGIGSHRICPCALTLASCMTSAPTSMSYVLRLSQIFDGEGESNAVPPGRYGQRYGTRSRGAEDSKGLRDGLWNVMLQGELRRDDRAGFGWIQVDDAWNPSVRAMDGESTHVGLNRTRKLHWRGEGACGKRLGGAEMASPSSTVT